MNIASEINDGDLCLAVAGTHKGKSGTVRDLNISKTCHLTITVVQENGVRFKTLGKNVTILPAESPSLQICTIQYG